MTIQRYRDFDALDPFPSTWTDAIEAAMSVASAQFVLRIKPSDATVLEVPASAGAGAAVIWIEGSPRWIESNIEYASPGGGTVRSLDVWVVSTANSFTPGTPGEVDATNYAFTLVIKETGVDPTGVAIKRKIGVAHWNGTIFDSVTPVVGRPSPQTIGAATAADLAAEIAARTAPRSVLASLPGSPTTGDEILYQTAAMVTAGVGPWALRYDSTLSGTSKWKVLDADPWIVKVGWTSLAIPTPSFADFSDAQPAVGIPVAGDYDVIFGARLLLPGGGLATATVSLTATGAPPSAFDGATFSIDAFAQASVSGEATLSGISGTLKMQGTASVAGCSALARYIIVRPRRLG